LVVEVRERDRRVAMPERDRARLLDLLERALLGARRRPGQDQGADGYEPDRKDASDVGHGVVTPPACFSTDPAVLQGVHYRPCPALTPSDSAGAAVGRRPSGGLAGLFDGAGGESGDVVVEEEDVED